MPDIMMLLACLDHCLSHTTLRRLTQIGEALLSMSGRVAMLGVSRWTEPGDSDRTVQRFFNTAIACPEPIFIDQAIARVTELGRVNHAVTTT